MGNYYFDNSDPEDQMDSDENTPKNSRQESSSTTRTPPSSKPQVPPLSLKHQARLTAGAGTPTSLERQAPLPLKNQVIPSMEELSTIALTSRIGEFVQALNEIGTEEEWDRNFMEDHLDAALQEYGLSEGVNVCLGVHHAHDGWRTVFGRNAPNGNSDL
ncbi:hypothetical protein L207DRAFT_530319 [Hyaloscypha variabilis F]|uniref:Uncharacterized protein n=1 Tax=Hyaloscypha variabilis (strain UAMH 11265 / GT02V1 / F) TaxID=1149755 RepID=A0A2J6RK15_HYAVF|nr:hypothetical protein L207DRAFT_530319 [Hyaloscypha variabilis F]